MIAARVSPELLAAAAAGDTILAPNAELAAAIFDAIERSHRDARREIWATPRVRDFATWTREQHATEQLKDADSPRVLNDVEERELWRTVIDSTDVGLDMLDPAGAARAARRARRTLQDYAIPLRALAADGSEEVRAFLAWNHAFEQHCRHLGCIGSDSLQSALKGEGALSWIDSPAWRPAARRWLTSNGRALAPRSVAATQGAEFAASSPQEELSAMAQWARSHLLADPSFRAWICVPDLPRRRAETVDAFDAALAAERFELIAQTGNAPYAIAGGTPLGDYAPVRAALDLLAVCSGPVPFAAFSALLRSPQMQSPGNAGDAGAAALLDLRLRRHGASEADLDVWLTLAQRLSAREGHAAPAAISRLLAARRALGGLRGAQHLSAWVKVWVAAMEAGPWAMRQSWSSVEYQAAERFRELLATLATGDAVFGKHSRDSALRLLRRAARDTAFQVQTGVPAVWVSGQRLDPWLNYDGIWVAGCSDDAWPPPVAPVALLPVAIQREHGVIAASAETQLALAADLQSRWQERATVAVFGWAEPGDGRRSTPSPLLAGSARGAADLKIAGAKIEAAPPQPHWRAQLAFAPELDSLLDEHAPPVATLERTRGVSTLKAQSRCAFRGFAETRLDAGMLEPPPPAGFSEREGGNLVHYALEHVWSVLPDSAALQALLPPAQESLLQEAARRAVARACRSRDPGARWRAREAVRLPRLIGKWLQVERQRPPFSIEALELRSQGARFAGLHFDVRIDRIDRLADGTQVLIDYKAGAATIDWHGERPDNPQLPIYAVLRPQALAAVAYARVNAAKAGFVAESERREIFGARRGTSSLEGCPSLAALVRLWTQRIERIAAEFAAGQAAVAPTPKACKTCHLHALCRIPAPLDPDDAHD